MEHLVVLSHPYSVPLFDREMHNVAHCSIVASQVPDDRRSATRELPTARQYFKLVQFDDLAFLTATDLV